MCVCACVCVSVCVLHSMVPLGEQLPIILHLSPSTMPLGNSAPVVSSQPSPKRIFLVYTSAHWGMRASMKQNSMLGIFPLLPPSPPLTCVFACFQLPRGLPADVQPRHGALGPCLEDTAIPISPVSLLSLLAVAWCFNLFVCAADTATPSRGL